MERNLHLDRLRGVASLGVVLSHAYGYSVINVFNYVFPIRIGISVAENSYHAVTLFFVISGFLITNKILNSSDKCGRFSLRRFYIDRVARIAPCLVLMVAAALGLAAAGIAAFKVNWAVIPSALWTILTFHFNTWIPGKDDALPRLWHPLWSLSIEEVFYLGFPALMLLLPRRLLLLGLSALLVVGPVCRTDHNPYSYLGNFDQLAIGVLTAFISRRFSAPSIARRLCRWFGIGVILATFLVTQDAAKAMVWGPEFVGAGAAIYLFGATRSPRPKSFGVLWVPAIFGRLSYEVYLLHMFFFVALGNINLLPMRIADPYHFDVLIFPAFMTALLISAIIISKTYSEPANRIVRRALSWGKLSRSKSDRPAQDTFRIQSARP